MPIVSHVVRVLTCTIHHPHPSTIPPLGGICLSLCSCCHGEHLVTTAPWDSQPFLGAGSIPIAGLGLAGAAAGSAFSAGYGCALRASSWVSMKKQTTREGAEHLCIGSCLWEVMGKGCTSAGESR